MWREKARSREVPLEGTSRRTDNDVDGEANDMGELLTVSVLLRLVSMLGDLCMVITGQLWDDCGGGGTMQPA